MPSELQKRNVVFLDDDNTTLRAYQTFFGRFFQVQIFGSGSEFLAHLHNHEDWRPDLLVTDLHMPDISGIDLIIHFSAIGVDIATVLLTGDSDPAIKQEALTFGAKRFLEKPIRMPHLKEQLEQILIERSADIAHRTQTSGVAAMSSKGDGNTNTAGGAVRKVGTASTSELFAEFQDGKNARGGARRAG